MAALEPKRQRGRQRVSAILAAAAALFAEKGYDATTMTEIAANARTAIGSLYRFFPTKEILADALLSRYGERMTAALDALTGQAAHLSPSELAGALVALKLELQTDRAAALALIDLRSDATDKRLTLRQSLRTRLAALLTRANPALPPAMAERKGLLLLQLLKLVPLFASENGEDRDFLIDEIRTLLRLYIADALSPVKD
jgi:AcrR family transcriptional regulator